MKTTANGVSYPEASDPFPLAPKLEVMAQSIDQVVTHSMADASRALAAAQQATTAATTATANATSAATAAATSRVESVVGKYGADALELMATSFDTRRGDVRLGVASDSTGNDPGDWPRVWLRKIAARWPHLRITHRLWNDAAQAYGAESVVQTGAVLAPASDGNYLVDEFDRSGEVVGTTSTSGAAWVGQTGVSSTDGTSLVFAKVGAVGVNTQQRGGTLAARVLVASSTSTAQQVRVIAGSPGYTTGRGVFVYLAVSASGAVTAGAYANTTAGGMHYLGAITGHGIAGATAGTQAAIMSVRIDGQNITATCGLEGKTPGTLSAQISEAEYAELGTAITVASASGATPSLPIDRLTYTGPATPEVKQTLEVWNASIPGATFETHTPHLSVIFPPSAGTPAVESTPATTTASTVYAVKDTFGRSGALVGTSPDAGATWAGSSAWTTNGSAAVAAANATGLAYVDAPTSGGTLTAQGKLRTAKTAAASLRYFLAADTGGVNGVCMYVSVSASGAPSAGAYVRTSSAGYRLLGTLSASALTAVSSSDQAYSVRLSLDGLNVSASLTVGSTTTSGTWPVTQAEADEVASLKRAGIAAAAGDISDWPIDYLDVVQTVTTTSPAVIASPAIPGTSFDVLLVAMGHNYSALAPAPFLDKVTAFADRLGTSHPEARLLIASQNAEAPPATNIEAHALRQRALRLHAKARGWAYIGGLEAFTGRPDGGASLIADGIHPTANQTNPDDPTTGGNVWAQAALEALEAHALT